MYKKIVFFFLLTVLTLGMRAQSCYWVVLTDKAGTTFDPYSYFDAKAIERYRLNNADLYDISNYPLNNEYVGTINGIATEEVGSSRWLNAVAVMATDEQISLIKSLPFVKQVDLIANEMQICQQRSTGNQQRNAVTQTAKDTVLGWLTDQLHRMQGELFNQNQYNGNNIRVAVFDGGFHAVNTHEVFRHLRERNAIIATWDFTSKQANVYDRHTHGTMVLSCIAGNLNGHQLGLATGATFLLAKTEVEPEPFKEEVWWAQAMEWADKNGADIINSSLGYGGDRHYTTEMDGTSYVARAANMAARKGILVCNSAGNEGDDNKWKTIITPADADSILAVGGIEPSLTSYKHIAFSSFGPSADGRQKPNICAFGYAEVADPHNDDKTTFAYGTSFASPLAAGFAACALQAVREQGLNFSAMQMKSEIEQSGDLYPYCDYAFGYGVPQASYFIDYPKDKELRDKREPAFAFEEIKALSDFVIIAPQGVRSPVIRRQTSIVVQDGQTIRNDKVESAKEPVFIKVENKDGLIEEYVHLQTDRFAPNTRIAIPKGALCGKKLTVFYGGTTRSYSLPKADNLRYANYATDFTYHYIDTTGFILDGMDEELDRTLADNEVPAWGVGQRWNFNYYVGYGIPWFFGNSPMAYSDTWHIGFRFLYNFKKWYSLGLAFDINTTYYSYQPDAINRWDTTVNKSTTDYSDAEKKTMYSSQLNLELFQRIRLMPGGPLTKKGLFWDLGLYGGLEYHDYEVQYNESHTAHTAYTTIRYGEVEPFNKHFNFGLTTRLGWDFVALYGRYRLSQPDLDMPRLELGLELNF